MGKVRTEKRKNKAALIKKHGEEKAFAMLRNGNRQRRKNILMKALSSGRTVTHNIKDKEGAVIASYTYDKLSPEAQRFLMSN